MDSIELGSAMANVIYVVLILAAIFGGIYYFLKKRILLAVTILSILLNFTSILYFMGGYFKYKYLYMIDHRIWPFINVILLMILIINKIKNAKKIN